MLLVWVRNVLSETMELARDVGAAQIGAEEPEDVELARAQIVDESGRAMARPARRRPGRGEHPSGVPAGGASVPTARRSAVMAGPSSRKTRT